jgi:hypothetical protein
MGVILVEFKHALPMIGIDDCGGCCQTSDAVTDGRGEVYGCHEKNTVLTNREEEVLKKIRELSLRARTIKEKLSHFVVNEEADEAARRSLAEELASLRQRRSQLESERIAAAEERMRLLGHA